MWLCRAVHLAGGRHRTVQIVPDKPPRPSCAEPKKLIFYSTQNRFAEDNGGDSTKIYCLFHGKATMGVVQKIETDTHYLFHSTRYLFHYRLP